MQWAKLRPYALVAVVAVAVATMLPSFGGGGSGDPHPVSAQRTGYDTVDCGTFPSAATDTAARVIALRAVSCGRALAVARAYDRDGKLLGDWRCAREPGPQAFSCGSGPHQGGLRNAPHALLVKRLDMAG